MQVRNITPSPVYYSGINKSYENRNQNKPSFKVRFVIDNSSFMKCKYNGYKMLNVARNLENRLQNVSDDFEITLRGKMGKLCSLLEYLYLAPGEIMIIELKYLLPYEKIKKMVMDIEAENPFLYRNQRKQFNEDAPSMIKRLKAPSTSHVVFTKVRDKKIKTTPEETKQFEETVYNKILKMIDEMPDRVVNPPRYY